MAACAYPAPSPAQVSAQRAAQVRAHLIRQIKRGPDVITRRWFLRKAGLVQFKLPVTLRLRPNPAPSATADLGASLGPRAIALGGSIAADVTFSDSYDGGTLGDVGIEFRESDTHALTTSPIPLLWNTDAPPCGADGTTVLRTNPLDLQVAGRGGGHANLFGNIPGRNVSVDVTLSLTTVINAVVRVLDEDAAPDAPCRELWTGATHNAIPGIHLQGQLRISPALLPDGRLRIAQATVSSVAPARTALSACLLPVTTYADDSGAPAGRPCGGPSDPDLGVAPLAAQDGAQVTVAGDISVGQASVDVIIGDA